MSSLDVENQIDPDVDPGPDPQIVPGTSQPIPVVRNPDDPNPGSGPESDPESDPGSDPGSDPNWDSQMHPDPAEEAGIS